jgi:Domain of unknown function (DUF4333)
MTCTTCFTLNPPAAPACVRCNTPLDADATPATGPAAIPGMVARPAVAPPAAGAEPAAVPGRAGRPGGADPVAGPVQDPTEGSKRIGPGLSTAAEGAPGSSRARAAAVQPPGYGLDTGDPEPPPSRAPVEDPRVGRRVALVGALLVLAVLMAGGTLLWLTRPRYLDSAAVQRQIAAGLTGRLGGPVAVSCPGDQRRRAGVTFRCSATDNAGGRRTVTVTVVDDSGKYAWTLGTA